MGRMFNPVSFTAPATAAAPAQPLGAPYANAPIAADADPARTALLKALVAGQVAPDYSSVRTPIEGIAKALTSGLQGWETSKLAKSEQADKTAQASALADLLMGPSTSATPDPKRAALVSMLSNGTLAPSSLSSAVADRLGLGTPPAPTKLGPGESLVGRGPDGSFVPLYTAPESAGGTKPMTVAPGNSVWDPNTKSVLYTAPAAPGQLKPYTDAGQIQADLAAGFLTKEQAAAEMARLPGGDAPKLMSVSPGQTVFDPATKAPVYTAPSPSDLPTPPSGYRWNADHTALEAIPGGPAMGGRTASAPPGYRWTADGQNLEVIPGGPAAMKTDFTNESKLRAEVQGLPSYKNLAQATPIYRSMLDTADRNSRASDLNLVYGLGKIMDPNSVVREGEMLMVRNTASLPDWFIGTVNSINGGAGLTPDTRKAILAEAKTRLDAYQQTFDQDAGFYRRIAEGQGMDPMSVLPSFPALPAYTPGGTGSGSPDGSAPARPRAVNPQTGETIEFDGTNWVPVK